MNHHRPYQIPRDCALPSLAELLRIDAEEEARMAAKGDPEAKERQKGRQTDLEKLRKRIASQERQSTVERLRKAIERRGSSR